MKRESYHARVTSSDDVGRTPEMRDLALRRTRPFLDRGIHLSLEHLMQEAYVQGIRDAVQVMA